MAKLTDLSQTERPAPRVGGAPQIDTRVRADNTLAQGLESMSRDVNAGLEIVYRQAKVEEDRVNTLRAEEAFTKLRDQQLELSIGTDGFTTLKGSQALNRPVLKEWGKRFDDAERGILEGLANDDQRRKFKQRSQVARLQFNEDVMRHLAREGDVYAKEVFDGAIATEQRNAIARWDSPNDVAGSIMRIESLVNERAERYGWPKEYRQAIYLQEVGKIHGAVIGQAIASGKYRFAQIWYEKNKKFIDEPTAKQLQHAVVEGTQKELAAGYNSEYLAMENSAGGLQGLHRRILEDKQLDDTRRNVLVGRVQNRLAQLEHKTALAEERRLRLLQNGIAELNANTLAGFEPTAEQFAPVIAAARGTELEPMVNQAINLANATRTFRAQPPAVQERLLAEAEAGVRKDPGKFDRRVVSAWRTIHEAQKEQVRRDPISFAVRQGIVEQLKPLDLSEPRQQEAALRERFAIARGMASRYQAPVKPLTTEEATLASAVLKVSTAQDKAQFFAGLAQAAGDDYEGYSAIMGQLAPDDPATAVAGTYAYRGRTQAADLILRGQQVLHPQKKEDGKPDQGKLWPMPPEKDLRSTWQSYEKDAFAGHPGARNAMYQAALAIYAAKSVDEGDSTGVINTGRWEESIRLATGGIEKHKGKAIVLPYGQEYGQFRDGLRARIDLLVDAGRLGPNITASRLEDLPLEAVGDGRYVFRAGDGLLVDKEGKPVIIDFNLSLPYRFSGDALAPRDREPTPAELEAARQPVTGRVAPEARRQPAAPARAATATPAPSTKRFGVDGSLPKASGTKRAPTPPSGGVRG